MLPEHIKEKYRALTLKKINLLKKKSALLKQKRFEELISEIDNNLSNANNPIQ